MYGKIGKLNRELQELGDEKAQLDKNNRKKEKKISRAER